MRISSGVEGIARIEIKKRIDLVQVIIYMGFPKWLIEGKPRGIEELQINVQKVQIAGHIDGEEIARVEWIREGRVPLQTIRAKIDYCSYTVRTIYGVLGIKIWIFADEK
ncbi:hypothetical protein MKW92_053479 [Papaver armeniacum]|nr:hypothetical protein MKW92_053479 [Papaver armeniacum]